MQCVSSRILSFSNRFASVVSTLGSILRELLLLTAGEAALIFRPAADFLLPLGGTFVKRASTSSLATSLTSEWLSSCVSLIVDDVTASLAVLLPLFALFFFLVLLQLRGFGCF